MGKISTINLGGRVISMEDYASQMYTAYVKTLHQYFINEEGGLEIMNDIENRAAELMQQTMNKCNTCINKTDIENVIRVIGTADDLKELDTDDWEMCTGSSRDSNAGNGLPPISPMPVLAEDTFVHLEGFKLYSN